MRNIIIIGIITAALFFVGHGAYLAFNGFALRPDKVISVRFKEVPPVIKLAGDIGVYYRGYKVGKATCKKLSNDQKYILFCLEITYKNLKLPVNTEVILKTQDIFGDRYFDLIYPDKPSEKLLSHGDTIDGTAVYERVDKYLVEELENGKLAALVSNLNYLTGGLKSALGGKDEELNKISRDVTGSVEDLSYITKELKTLLANPAVKKEIKEALAYTPQALKNINEILAEKQLKNVVKRSPELIEKTIANLESVSNELPKINQGIKAVNDRVKEVNTHIPNVNTTLCGTNTILSQTNQELGCLNPKIPVIPQDLITQTDKTLRRYDCIGEALSETMSKNCLFFRFLFGTPGEPFKDCICE